MTPMPSLTASSASASATRTLRSSDSTTHGPAMRNGDPPPKRAAILVGQLRERARRLVARLALAIVHRGADEAREQRVRAHRPRLELGMELAADVPRMLGQLDHLDERAVGRKPRAAHAELGEHVAIRVRHFV